MRRTFVPALLTVGLIAAMVTSFALATAAKDVSSVTLAPASRLDPIDIKVKTGDWEAEIETKGTSDLAVSENTVKPGGHFGWHSHPGPSLVIVKSGTSTFYRGDDPDCTPEVHPAGTAYVDPGGVVHTARNEGSVDLVLVVTRLTPRGAIPRIDAPDPGNCPF
jgi:quercetin dioxygenase-like cupin family protein